jgi:hypothetical protein
MHVAECARKLYLNWFTEILQNEAPAVYRKQGGVFKCLSVLRVFERASPNAAFEPPALHIFKASVFALQTTDQPL